MAIIVKHRARSLMGPRPSQQDRVIRYFISGYEFVLLAVLDGMGGMKDGEATAEALVAWVCKAFEKRITGNCEGFTLEQIAIECVLHAQLYGLMLYNSLEEPGATITLGVANAKGEVGVAWLGDSPAILLTKDGCRLLTKPHNVNADTVYQEKTGATSGDSLTRFIGEKDYILPPDSICVQLAVGDHLFLCTDGVIPLFRNPNKETPTAKRFDDMHDSEFSDNASFVEIFVEESPAIESEQEEKQVTEDMDKVQSDEPVDTSGSCESDSVEPKQEQKNEVGDEETSEGELEHTDGNDVPPESLRRAHAPISFRDVYSRTSMFNRLPVAP